MSGRYGSIVEQCNAITFREDIARDVACILDIDHDDVDHNDGEEFQW